MIGNAEWHVVPLREALAELGVGSARSVMFVGLDEFFSSVSIERAMDDYAFIAMRVNGVPLPAAHGFPARVILPDLYGMKQPRWLKRIALQEDAATTSFWEQRGWAGEVPVKITSRIDPVGNVVAGKPQTLHGIAFAGAQRISRVEISLDDGRSWAPCELLHGLEPQVWTTWSYVWETPTPAYPGARALQVRAWNGQGQLQIARQRDPLPDGASGYDRERVEVARA